MDLMESHELADVRPNIGLVNAIGRRLFVNMLSFNSDSIRECIGL